VKNRTGYGLVKISGKRQAAHRASYTLSVGPIPEGLLVRHTCDNRLCINPDHLLVGTNSDNTADMYTRGRQASKLTPDDVAIIRASSEKGTTLAREYGVSDSTISKARLGRSWASL
jgi:hypothetical protein